jgi:hypothetical protein
MKRKKAKQPFDPEAFARLVSRLASIGWIEQSYIAQAPRTKAGLANIRFTQKGLAHIHAFYALHKELGDISEDDRKFL